ncbi:MAG: molecular chaperone TorD family protein [Myxococcota bacterium]
MSPEVLQDLESPGERAAAAHSRAWRLFAEAFGYPEGPLLEAIREGALANALRDVLAAIGCLVDESIDWDALRNAGRDDELAVEYTRLFDVGVSGPPCPLYGGLYGDARMKTMEEAVRFYNHFGLTLSEEPRELPDHLTTELEFLHYLAFREAEALQTGADPGPFQRAQRDFVARHPGRWVPRLRERLAAQDPPPFYLELVRALEALLGTPCSA